MALGTKVGGASSPRLGSRREHRQSFHLLPKMGCWGQHQLNMLIKLENRLEGSGKDQKGTF